MGHHLAQAVRSLLYRPGFTALVVLITGLCIGGNASVFSVAKAALFQDIPYAEAERLVVLNTIYRPTGTENDLSYPDIVDYRDRMQLIEEISPFLGWRDRLLRLGDTNERIGVSYVAPSHLKLLGVQPALGRIFSPDEDGAPGSAPVTILSYGVWQQHFSGDPDLVGKTVQMNNKTYTVVGIMPQDFFDVAEMRWDVEAWLPAAMAGDSYPPHLNIYEWRVGRIWFALGRLKPGVTVAQALEEMDGIARQLETEYPDSNAEYSANITPIREFMFGDLYPSMRLLLFGAVLVLFIGCANIAGLLMVRVVERRIELTLRLALGAQRSQLVVQVFLESLLLALVGGALGVLLAFVGTELLAGSVTLPVFASVAVDPLVLSVILAVSMVTGILFGLPPALSAARMEVKGALMQRDRGTSGGGLQASRRRNLLLVFQVALVTILLLTAGLLLRSFLVLHNVGVDFDTDRILTLRMPFGTEDYVDRQNIVAAERALLKRLEDVPGIESAVFWGPGIPGIETGYLTVQAEGADEDAVRVRGFTHMVSPGALKTLGIPLLRGRELTEQDTPETQRVAVVSQSVAEAFWPKEDAIGKRIERPQRPDEPVMEIVGVIPNSKLHGRFGEGTDQIILSHAQRPTPNATLVVRSSGPPASVIDRLRQEIRHIDPGIPVYDVMPLEERMAREENDHRLNAMIVSMYSVLALIFTVLGLYGTLAYSVLQRQREIGVRVAMGARAGDILKLVIGQGIGLVAVGVVLGLISALGATRLLTHLLFEVTERDPITFISVVVILGIVALGSTLLPARRALKVEPSKALRFE